MAVIAASLLPIAKLDEPETQADEYRHHGNGRDLHGEASCRFSAASKPNSRFGPHQR